jgi:uncharacterized membrane protein
MGQNFLLKIGARTVNATLQVPFLRTDLSSQKQETVDSLGLNDIAQVTLTLDRAIPVDGYKANRQTGSFILIDRETNDTMALGMVELKADSVQAIPAVTSSVAPVTSALAISHETAPHSTTSPVLWARLLGWRIVATLITAVIVYALTQNLPLTLAVAGFDCVLKLIAQPLFERWWARK